MSSPSGSLQISDLKSEAINVVVRCRGRNDREISSKNDVVVDVCDRTGSKEVSVNTSNDSSIVGKMSAKTFTVDQVFGPGADQEMIFNKVALPLFNEFVQGFNCTIFAYGQTGTGKTHTMCGDDRTINGSYSPDAGIIPRVLFQLFTTLQGNPHTANNFVVKCSLVEIYNESLKDLLNAKSRKELKIYEESIRTIPGKADKSAVFIKDLDEICVRNAMEGIELLRKGLIDRKTASTNMNKASSRSHTIFSISLYKKDSEDYYRFSKMNLVDLAGSENISRSGATDLQAKEAGLINRSLLSLGKVINALVDNNLPPYRDSKLTRLLKDSLGGETKTVLIANISPSRLDADETTKTLEYASKAKNIMNTPQVGNLMLKHVIVRDLVDEASKLRKDLMSCWAKDGVTMDKGNYDQLKKDLQHYKVQVEETNRKFEFQQNQNKILTHDINNTMDELTQLKEKVKDLHQVNNILNVKLQKQQNSERMFQDSTKKYKELIALFDSGISDLENTYNTSNSFLKIQIHDKLEFQVKKLVETIEKNFDSNIDVKANLGIVKESVQAMIKNFTESALEICDNTTSSLTSKLPSYFEELKLQLENDSTGKDIQNLSNNLDRLTNIDDKFDKFLSKKLFNNHEDLLKRHLGAINAQNETMKKEFLADVTKLFDSHYKKTMDHIPNQITELCSQIVDSEKDLLSGERFDWLDSKKSVLQDQDSLINRLVLRLDENKMTMSEKIESLNNVTSDSKLILEDERNKITDMISKIKSEQDIESHLTYIQTKFDQASKMRSDTMEEVLNVIENLAGISDKAQTQSEKTLTNPQSEKISQLLQTIENNSKMIDSTIMVPKSRTASPIRQPSLTKTSSFSVTPSRSRHVSPLRSVSRSAPASRHTSRVNSRNTSPIKSEENKENVFKRKQEDQQLNLLNTQVIKKLRSLPVSIKSKKVGNLRKPFR